ncbi:LOG family protein [Nocardia vaccinii]|uniref:LOG family protein n=1 Tax=Nocardia vaccinii TaxID=1822 RepID=UPI00083136DE|nr:TIGR00730 family Rossman fold protein [Nocardia vaccinii]
MSRSARRYSVCVFCSASTVDPAHLALATQVGAEIADRRWQLVSGGGRVAMMGAVATAARAGGAHTIGVIPRHLAHREVADIHADELLVTETMRERKQIMADRADAFLTLPGGIGTLEEFLEIWTSADLGMHDKPVVVLDPYGHYRGLFEWISELQIQGFVGNAALERMTVASCVSDAFAALRTRL